MFAAIPRRALLRPRAIRFARKPRAFASRYKTTPSNDTAASVTATAKDLQNLQQELKVLQQLIREQKSHSYHVESLTRSVSAQSATLEERLESIESHVSRIGALEQIASDLRHFVQANPAIRVLLKNLETMVNRSTPWVRKYKYAILGALATMIVVWRYRASIFYESASEEVADLARRTLEQDSLRLSIQETLHTVANNPSTLETLNELIQQLITHESTQKELVDLVVYAANTPEVQKALFDLLQMIFQDPYLQQLTAEFLLRGLDVESAREMLDAQTAELVRDTVSNDSVQKATAAGVQRTLWYTITPPFLWRYLPRDTTKEIQQSKEGDEETEVAVSEPDNSDGKQQLPSQ